MNIPTTTLNISMQQTSLLPKATDISTPFKQLVNAPSELECIPCQNAQIEAELKARADALRAQIEQIKNVFGAFPLSNPMNMSTYPGLSTPEMEIEKKIHAMIQEYPSFVYVKILQIITTVIPINLNIPLFGINIDIVRYVNDPIYHNQLKQQIASDIDHYYSMLPGHMDFFDGTNGITSPAMRAQLVIDNISAKVKSYLSNTTQAAFTDLIAKYKNIWDHLNLPGIPNLTQYLDFNLEDEMNTLLYSINTQITNLKSQISNLQDRIDQNPPNKEELIAQLKTLSAQLTNLYSAKVNTLLNFKIFGFGLSDIVGNIDDMMNDKTAMADRKLEKITLAVQSFQDDFIHSLIQGWMEKVESFFTAISLNPLITYTNFDFSKFIMAQGIPFNFSVEIPKCPYA